jgi:quercetin 2,3-dioxygenase
MSNLDRTPPLTACGGLTDVAPKPVQELFTGREVQLGESTMVRRLLPNLGRRLVGPWCFVDHYGPDDVATAAGMAVPPHPHIGLQTVSWLVEGAIHHRDSIGSDAMLHPGALGLMTSGRGITHAEYSPVPHPSMLHGVQLWVALPDESRFAEPAWELHDALPVFTDSGVRATVIMGSLGGARSPGTAHSPMVGVDLHLDAGADTLLPLEPEFEHAALVMSGDVTVDGVPLSVGSMLYLGCARRDLRVRTGGPARVMLLGGAPFEEQIVMWWNFVGRSNDAIEAAREEWMTGSRFGVVNDAGDPLPAPPMPPGRLKPGGSVRH